MFTGIIETVGRLEDTRPVPGGRRLRVAVGDIADACPLGASVAVNGVCLTVAQTMANALDFDAVTETLSKSLLGEKHIGDRLNIERALRVGDRLDGHFVQGHVDGTARVRSIVASAQEHVITLEPPAALMSLMIPKGSVTLDGVSLTIADVTGSTFSVAIIPTTLALTTLVDLQAGDRVNVESDILVRTIMHQLGRTDAPGGLTMDTLRQAGYA